LFAGLQFKVSSVLVRMEPVQGSQEHQKSQAVAGGNSNDGPY
jgi:hypothetical protein